MIKHINKFKKTIHNIKSTCQEIYTELGPGYAEDDYQQAMSIEFKESTEFNAMREIPIELFYKGQFLKFGEMDFLIEPKKGTKGYPLPFMIETKMLGSGTEKAAPYDQMRTYLMNIQRNTSSVFKSVEVGVLIGFKDASVVIDGEAIKEEKKIIAKKPSKLVKPDTVERFWKEVDQNDIYIKCFTFDNEENQLKLIENIT